MDKNTEIKKFLQSILFALKQSKEVYIAKSTKAAVEIKTIQA